MTASIQVISKISNAGSTATPFIDEARDINLPNDHSFVIFGAGQNQTSQLATIVSQVAQEVADDITPTLFVQYHTFNA